MAYPIDTAERAAWEVLEPELQAAIDEYIKGLYHVDSIDDVHERDLVDLRGAISTNENKVKELTEAYR